MLVLKLHVYWNKNWLPIKYSVKDNDCSCRFSNKAYVHQLKFQAQKLKKKPLSQEVRLGRITKKKLTSIMGKMDF